MLQLIEKQRLGVYWFINPETRKETKLSLQFFDGFDLEKGDLLIINEKLLDKKYKGYAPHYAFSVITNNLKKESSKIDKDDLGVVKRLGKEYLIKRLYG